MAVGGNAPIKVCFPFAGRDLGGSHISALRLVAGFDRARVSPVVVVQHNDGPLAALLAREHVPFVHLPIPEPLPRNASPVAAFRHYLTRVLPHLRRFLKRERFDVVHTNDGHTHATWGPAARLVGAKLVWHHRGDPEARGANRLAPLIAHHMVTVSHFSRPRRPWLPMARRLSVIRSPFEEMASPPDRTAAKAALLQELGLAPDTRVLGYFGVFVDRKRPLLFVDIVHRLRCDRPEIPVVGCLFGASALGGPDFEEAVRARAAALGIGSAIRLMGFRRPVEPFMAATDILIVPAIAEPFGRTLIEAMFLGTPVVATANGGNPEAIDDGRTGFLVEPENPAAFVPAIAGLLSDPALFSRIADTARDEARRSFDADDHVREVAGLYERILGGGKVPAPIHTNPSFP
ncbi:glycosyl transferase [Aureimonas sp. SA4125]|uniref:glycosyltransferase family 4 protein n=1 Tax=Aureimonas sp. SA4125 TaxID=2826993 RepID=UPI001CC46872|nr:glycosyltransferase family 4 protein [Aureimonas sp. SA4125]BDA82957.1 glycosyl transferase [Aureimonas sp. SA4125]